MGDGGWGCLRASSCALTPPTAGPQPQTKRPTSGQSVNPLLVATDATPHPRPNRGLASTALRAPGFRLFSPEPAPSATWDRSIDVAGRTLLRRVQHMDGLGHPVDTMDVRRFNLDRRTPPTKPRADPPTHDPKHATARPGAKAARLDDAGRREGLAHGGTLHHPLCSLRTADDRSQGSGFFGDAGVLEVS